MNNCAKDISKASYINVALCGLTKEEIVGKYDKSLGVDFFEICTLQENCLDALIRIEIDKIPIDKVKVAIADILSPYQRYIYSMTYDNDNPKKLAEVLFDYLEITQNKLGVAESLTGGMIASEIISVGGASKYFMEGIVAYDNQAKTRCLGVRENTLNQHTAVSPEVAYQMAQGMLDSPYLSFAISTTGYADSNDICVPAGLVYIGIGDRRKIDVHKLNLTGSRNEIRKKVTNMAIYYAIKRLKGNFDINDY